MGIEFGISFPSVRELQRLPVCAAPFVFPVSDAVGDKSVEIGDTVNTGIGVGILFQHVLECEI